MNTYSSSEKALLSLTGVTAILTAIPFLFYGIKVMQSFIGFCLTPADPTLILITAGLAYAVVFLLYVGAVGGCVIAFGAFLACGILNLSSLKNTPKRFAPVSVTVVFIFDIILISIAAIPLFVICWHVFVYRDMSGLIDLAVIGVPLILAAINLTLAIVFKSQYKTRKFNDKKITDI